MKQSDDTDAAIEAAATVEGETVEWLTFDRGCMILWIDRILLKQQPKMLGVQRRKWLEARLTKPRRSIAGRG